MKRILTAIALFTVLCAAGLAAPKPQVVKSPDGRTTVTVTTDGEITYTVIHNAVTLLDGCPVKMLLNDGTAFDGTSKLRRVSRRSVDQTLPTIIYKKDRVRENFNEMTLNYKTFSLIFRVYDDGAAYRFVSALEGDYIVKDEPVEFKFAEDWAAYIPYSTKKGDYDAQHMCSYQSPYTRDTLSHWKDGKTAWLPFLVEAPQGIRVLVTEADLFNYPGLSVINPDKDASVNSFFQRYPAETKLYNGRLMEKIVKSEDYIARCEGPREFPWRVIAISDNDIQMTENDMVYKLSKPADTSIDYSWIKPGQVAWDWWNNWNLYGVDFRAGINNETYKYYIDFAGRNGIEYVIMDEGWSVPGAGDLFQVIPEIDIRELVEYGRERNVGIVLWAGFKAFDRDMENVCKYYSEMGVKGFKVDFINRTDQLTVDFYERAARMTQKYHLMIDYHGAYKPTGLHRTYPNAINFEGVYGLEENKLVAMNDNNDQVIYDVTAPYIRYVAGPADYTQGAMHNVRKENFSTNYWDPMSVGTRCHQLAEYVIFYAPFNMLCDSPSNYEREQECTTFMASVPEVWDESLPLQGEITKYAVIARRSGDDWYLGALNNWDERDLSIDLSFLGEGEWKMEIFRDGINADRAPWDYKHAFESVPDSRRYDVHMAPGGGWIARFTAQ